MVRTKKRAWAVPWRHSTSPDNVYYNLTCDRFSTGIHGPYSPQQLEEFWKSGSLYPRDRVEPADPPQKETVILVHGTFAAPRSSFTNWYQSDPASTRSFMAKLDAALAQRGSKARCWAHCERDTKPFHWSGANDWTDRATAANALAEMVTELQSKGWTCHIVAHSHGGNLVVDALPLIQPAPPDWESRRGILFGPHASSLHALSGKIVTLGTPFIDTTTKIAKLTRWRSRVVNALGWAILLPSMPLLVLQEKLGKPGFDSGPANIATWLLGTLLIWSALILVFSLAFGQFSPRSLFTRGRNAPTAPSPKLLCVNSRYDEAWQLLHHVSILENPLRPKRGLMGYLFDYWKAFTSKSKAISRLNGALGIGDLDDLEQYIMAFVFLAIISANVGLLWETAPRFLELPVLHSAVLLLGLAAFTPVALFVVGLLFGGFTGGGAAGVVSASLAPTRWIWRQMRAAGGVPGAIATYVVLRRGWLVVQENLMGLDGYRHCLPSVEAVPSRVDKAFVVQQDMPESAERTALANRDGWLIKNFGVVSDTFAKLVLTSSDLASLIHTIETDLTLVHAAYYTDDACIGQIADWIAQDAPLSPANQKV